MEADGLDSFTSTLGIEPPDTSEIEIFHESSKLYPACSYRFGERVATYLTHPRAVLETARNYKTYFLARKIALPDPVPVSAPLSEALARRRSVRRYEEAAISQQYVSDLLGATARANRMVTSKVVPDTTFFFRPYPSGGGLYPVEIYPILLRVDGLPSGVTHYDPRTHQLQVIQQLPTMEVLAHAVQDYEGLLGKIALALVLTACFERSTVKYGNRGYRFALMEAGLVGFLSTLAGAGMGISSLHWGAYLDDPLNDVLGVDGVGESVVNCIFFGKGAEE